MEAVPRLPMLAFELKHSPEYVDFGPTLKKYIRDHYGEDPALYNKNFAELDQLRQNAIHVTRDFVGCATLKRYYAQLQMMNGRFPMGEGGEAAITFTWEDNQTGRDHILADIKFEQACILYNIGALHSNLGAIDTRQNAEGMKVSCTHFQCAAWAFEHLRDHFGSSSMSTDMAHEYLTFHINVMLAQAQECILEKSMIDSRKNTITAKVAAQVVEFYRSAVKNLNQCNSEQIINSRSYKDWKKRIELKIAFYQCITYYYMGRQSEDQQKWGERLSYFQAAQAKLGESIKLAKNEVPEMQDALSFGQDVVGGKLQSAQKDNDFVYHEKIPPVDSLPEVKGAPLVKGIPFDPTDSEISGPDIFQKLVPMEAHEASSVYSEEKAKLLRSVVEDIETANSELEQFMTSLQIDPAIFEPMPDRLPQELLEKCAAMSVRTNAIKDLVDSMSGVSGLATEAEMSIKEIQDMIAEDTQKTEEFEKLFGKKMVSPVLPGLSKDCEAHLEKQSQGSQLNNTLHSAMNAHITNLRMLTLLPEQLQAQLPPAQPPKTAEDEEVLSEMRRLLNKVNEMRTQRAALEKQFREDIQKDDITTVLMAVDTTKENIFKDQLKKHDSLIGYIGQNLGAQNNILRALTDANAKFAALRQAIGQQSVLRENMIRELISCFDKYEELLAKSNKGQDYYRRLNEAVSKTLERCRSECKVRQEERDLIMSKYAPKAPPPSRPTAPKPGQGLQPGTPSMPSPASSLSSLPGADLGQLPAGVVPPVMDGSAALSTFEGPKLKDFLPFMKPQSFGPKRSSPSPQSLPPGSPDPMLSGPPSLASSASDSPQHRGMMQPAHGAPYTSLPAADPQGGVGAQIPGMRSMPAEAAFSGHEGSLGQPGYHPQAAPPPDVTAGLPIGSGPLPQGGLPDVSSLPFSSAMAAQAHGATFPSTARAETSETAISSSSSKDSTGSAGSYHQVHSDQDQPPILYGPASMPAASNSSQSLGARTSASNVPQQSGMLPYPHQQQQQQQQQLPQQYPAGSQHGAYPGAQGNPYQQNIGRPSPSPSPSGVSGASLPGMRQIPQQQGYSHRDHSSLPHLSGHTPQQGQQPSQHPQFPPQHRQQQQPYQQYQQQYYAEGMPPQHPSAQPSHPQQQPGLPNQQSGLQNQQPGLSSQQHPGLHIQQPGLLGQQQPGLHAQQQPGLHTQQQPGLYTQQPALQNQQQPGLHTQPGATLQTSLPSHIPGQPNLTPGHRIPGSTYLPQQSSYSQVPSSSPATSAAMATNPASFGQQRFGAPTPSVQGAYNAASLAGGRVGGLTSAGGGGLAQGAQAPGMQPYPQQLQQGQQAYGAVPQPQGPGPAARAAQQQPPTQPFPPPHSQQVSSQQPFQHQRVGVVQGQGQYSAPGQGVAGSFQGHHLPQQSVAGAVSVGGTSSQAGYYPSSASSPAPPQAGVPPGMAGQQTQPQQQFQPHPQQQRMPGYVQAQQGFNPTYASQQGQTKPSAAQGAFPGASHQQQAQPYQSQQFPPTQQQTAHFPQQQFPQQQQYQQPPYSQQQQQVRPQYPMQPQQAPAALPQQHQQQSRAQLPPGQQHPQSVPQPQFPQSQPQRFPQYPAPQQQQRSLPPESQLIFPTPLQPQKVHSPDVAQASTAPSQASMVPGASTPEGASFGQAVPRTGATPQQQRPPQSRSSLPPNPAASSLAPESPASGTAHGGPPSLMRSESSLDEILSSSPEGNKQSTIPAPIITPKVLTDQEKQQQKEEAVKKGAIVEAVKDPYQSSSVLNKFLSDVEAFGKFVDDLSITILGVSRLDTVWKSLIDSQDHDVKKQSIAIARCYPMKNRDPDIMPYDETRVVLSMTKDDYINASWVNDLAPSCPKFVATQAPVNVTLTDFWAMVYELGSEVIVQITSEYETSKKFPVYFPTEKGQQMEQGPVLLNLQSVKYRQLWTERNIYLKHSQTKQGRTVIHLQFKTWPVSGFPDDVQHILRFISEVHSFYKQQRSLLKPIIVHCGNGVGRTGAFLMIYTGIQEIIHGNGLTDIPALAKRMLQKRKNLMHKKEQLKFCYDAILCFAEDFLKKRNILVQHPHFEKKAKISEPAPAVSSSDDIVLGSVNLHTLQQTVGRLHVHGGGEKGTTEHPDHHPRHHNPPPSQPRADAEPMSALPDLIQQQPRGEAGMGQGCGAKAESGLPQAGQGQGLAGVVDGGAKTHSRSGSNASQQSLTSLTEAGPSSRTSPQHEPSPSPSASSFSHSPSPSGGGVSQSLTDLQDPTKFTIGKGDQRKRISKANFNRRDSGSGLDTKADPTDPLSSLDAMWSIHKPGQAEEK